MRLGLPEVQSEARQFLETAGPLLRKKLAAHVAVVSPDLMATWRVKSPVAIERKLQASGHLHSTINDFIGVRVIADNMYVLPEFEDDIRTWAEEIGLTLVGEVENLLEKPKPIGYRAIHFDYRFQDPIEWNLPDEASIEVQLTTWLQLLQASLSHRLLYAAPSPAPDSVLRALQETSTCLWRADRDLLEIVRRTSVLRNTSAKR